MLLGLALDDLCLGLGLLTQTHNGLLCLVAATLPAALPSTGRVPE
jgi:hypothetical protein